jgi:hypothetical protein
MLLRVELTPGYEPGALPLRQAAYCTSMKKLMVTEYIKYSKKGESYILA